jgi:triosephosphate isomerase
VGLSRAGRRPALKYFLANWKMYPTVDEARALLEAMQAGLLERVASGVEPPRVIVCPPFVALAPLRAVADDRVVRLGAQNCHWENEGPHTGEVSPRMLRGLVEYVMVGHSERRAAGETDDQIARKVAAVADNGLTPIVFVGEDSQDDDAVAMTEERLRHALSGVDVSAVPVLVVYEPAWAIGADHAAPAAHVERVVEHVKGVLGELAARQREILYGGTVAEENVVEFAALEVLDGMGATRSSLDPESFLRLIDRMVSARG